MTSKKVVTVVGSTGLQGSAVVRALLKKGKYQIRCLTRDIESEKAKKLQALDNSLELVKCDVTSKSDLQRAFRGSWTVFVVTDPTSCDQSDDKAEFYVGKQMADTAVEQKVPYFVFSTLANTDEISKGKYHVSLETNKAHVQEYLTTKCQSVKSIFVKPPFYFQNWTGFSMPKKLDDGVTVEFALPFISESCEHYQVDIDDIGNLVAEVLEQPDKYVGQVLMCVGDVLEFRNVPKIFTKVTGIPAVCRTLTETEYRAHLDKFHIPANLQDNVVNMFKFDAEFGDYQKKDWENAHGLVKFHTFEEWLKKTQWKGL